MITPEQATILQDKHNIPVTGFCADRYYIIEISRSGEMPTDDEIKQILDYREKCVRGFYKESYADEILNRPLVYDAGHNTVTFVKGKDAWLPNGDDGWAFRRSTWTRGPLYFPSSDMGNFPPAPWNLAEVIEYLLAGVGSFHRGESEPTVMQVLLTKQGTAAAEAAVCSVCDNPRVRARITAAADKDVVPHSWQEQKPGENPEIQCWVCGFPKEDEDAE